MHTVQILLVSAKSVEEAMSQVAGTVASNVYPSWSDWSHTIEGQSSFAGRWEGVYFGKENVNDVLRFSDDPTLAMKVVEQFLSEREAAIIRLTKQLSDYDFDLSTFEYDADLYDTKRNDSTYTLLKLARLLYDDWTSDSGVYDLDYGTANLFHARTRFATKPEEQFLVAVDFHH